MSLSAKGLFHNDFLNFFNTVDNRFYNVNAFGGRSGHRLYTGGFHYFLSGEVVNDSVCHAREINGIAAYEYLHVVGSYISDTRFRFIVISVGSHFVNGSSATRCVDSDISSFFTVFVGYFGDTAMRYEQGSKYRPYHLAGMSSNKLHRQM